MHLFFKKKKMSYNIKGDLRTINQAGIADVKWPTNICYIQMYIIIW